MRYQKIIKGLNASPSQIKRKLRSFRPPGYNIDIDEMLALATQKISPIIMMLMENSTSVEHFIKVNDCDNLDEIVNIILDIVKALEEIGFETSVEMLDLDLQKYREKCDDNGYIYVDTTLLLGVLELYNILENLKADINAFYKTIGIHSFVQTESGSLSLTSSNASNPNKITFKFKNPSSRPLSSFSLLKNDFIVMPSASDIVPLKESQSQILGSSKNEVSSIKRVMSASSVEQVSEVTNVYGARKVVVKCIYDLQGVSNYLSIPRKDASTICSRVELDSSKPESSRRSSNVINRSRGLHSSVPEQHQELNEADSQHKCCCPECVGKGSKIDLQECEDDQVIICIKGCNEDEGDVQIVIRQCPDCKKAESPMSATPHTPPSIPRFESPRKSTPHTPPSTPRFESPRKSPPSPLSSPPRLTSSKKSVSSDKSHPKVDFSKSSHTPTETESAILHNKDSKGSVVCSDEEEENGPSYVQNRVSCSRIKLFETTNLCLLTEGGQELVISLTVTPKDLTKKPDKLNLKDIFSDSEDMGGTATEESFRNPKTDTYYVDDSYIPLGRTKMCSSLDFDVTTAQSKIRDKGIKNNNNRIVVQLQEFGTDNLLRACRPAKCCRKAILNEKMKKCLPYAPSLRSLPLDDGDMDVINQSLQMSLQKVKNSTNIKKDFNANNMYSVNPVRTVLYCFLEDFNCFVENMLSYYINLVNRDSFDACSNGSKLLKESLKWRDQSVPVKVLPIINSSLLLPNDFQSRHLIKQKYNILQSDVGSDLIKGTNNIANNGWINDESKTPFKEILQRICHTNLLKQKCKYYINLANDEFSFNATTNYNIAYFEVDGKNISNYVVHSELNMSNPMVDVRIAEAISNPIKWIRKKYHRATIEKLDADKKSFVSKIPVYLGPNRARHVEVPLKNVSSDTLPRQEEHTDLSVNLFPELPCPNQTRKRSVTIQSSDDYSRFSSKCSVATTIKRHNKRKKKEFYLSRSRSEISLGNLKPLVKSKSVFPANVDKNPNLLETGSKKTCTSYATFQAQQDSSKLILDYFTKILYQMIMQQMHHDKDNSKLNRLVDAHIGTDNASLQEIYRKPTNIIKTNKTLHSNTVKTSHHHLLKAKLSQYCIVPTRKWTTTHILFDKSSQQTSTTIFYENRKCQTSNTLLTYIMNSWLTDGNHIKKKGIFKKTINSYNDASCNEIENFIVSFNSERSIVSNLSDGEFLSSACSNSSSSQLVEETLSQSLLKLKATLETYETVKNEISKQRNVNPIEYFVYQVCACNGKLNKKPSVMQKILSKTKGLFSSVEKDLCNKYKNQREYFEKGDICHNCGCVISKCLNTLPKTDASPTLSCRCPQENKASKRGHEPCCKNQKDSKLKSLNLSKIASASTSSLKSLTACLKRSLSKTKKDSLGPCECAEKKSLKTICFPKNMTPVTCDKQTTSTGTTKDGSTQKCECGKCQNFAEDGTCCCSHCLGCLDKSFEAKPNNNSVAIATDAKRSSDSGTNSKTSDNSGILPVEESEPSATLAAKDISEESEPSGTLAAKDISEESEPSAILVAKDNLEDSSDGKGVEESVAMETLDLTADADGNNDATAYFFMQPPAQFLQQFGRSGNIGANPFRQCLFNFPPFNMIQLDNLENVADEM